MSPLRDHRRDPRHSSERVQTAWLLRAIRRAEPSAASEMIDWIFASVPDNGHVRRLKIEQLLRAEDVEAADALIAQWLLRRPSDAAMSMLRARCLHRQGRLRRADDEMRFVLRRRPRHVGALVLAAGIASGLEEHARAVNLLERAAARRPEDDRIRRRLVRALIADGKCGRAEQIMSELDPPAPLLEALLRRAQGRWLDAVAILRSALEANPDPAERTALQVQLIDLLEHIGDAAGLRELIDALDRTNPDVAARVASALLWLGSFRAAALAAARVVRRRRYERAALHTLVVAATLAGRGELARRGLRRLQRTAEGIDRRRMAAAWRKGLLARVTQEQQCPREAGTDPSTSILQPLLQKAVGTFDARLRDRSSVPPADAAALRTSRATCLAAMGRQREALADLGEGRVGTEAAAVIVEPRAARDASIAA